MNKTQDPAGTAASYGPGWGTNSAAECRSHDQCMINAWSKHRMNRMNRMNDHIERRGHLAARSGSSSSQSKIRSSNHSLNDSSKDSFCELPEGSFPVVLFFACYLSWVGKADHPKEAMLEVSRQGLADWRPIEQLNEIQYIQWGSLDLSSTNVTGEWASPRPFGHHNSDISVSWRGIVWRQWRRARAQYEVRAGSGPASSKPIWAGRAGSMSVQHCPALSNTSIQQMKA